MGGPVSGAELSREREPKGFAPSSSGEVPYDARFLGLFPRFQAVGQATRPCRVSLFVLGLGTTILFVPTQTAEALVALCQRHSPAVMAGFVVVTMGWGAMSWYFARQLLRFGYPDVMPLPPRLHSFRSTLVRWIPRMLGVAPPLATAMALLGCTGRTRDVVAPALMLLLLSGLFFWAIVKRRSALEALRPKAPDPRGLIGSLWKEVLDFEEPDKQRLSDLPRVTQWVLACNVMLSGALFATFAFVPVESAQWLGAPTVIALAFSSWIAVGSAIAYLSSWLRMPLLIFLAIEAILVSPFNDDHFVRERPTVEVRTNKRFVTEGSTPTRDALVADFAQWRQAVHAGPDTPYIVVATEGGGIRAAFWTAALLGALQDTNSQFADHLYAISSVSGGSLGAAVFLTLLSSKDGTEKIQQRAARILSDDGLAPPLAKALYPDLLQRFLPRGFSCFDRGSALEGAWERSVTKVTGEADNLFLAPWDAIWTTSSMVPRLFLNATWVESGGRVVFSYPRLPADRGVEDGDDLAALTLGQAVHASARFPYLSPALTILGSSGPWGHLVDGGYFENSGAQTARDIIDVVGRRGSRAIVIRYGADGSPPAEIWGTELLAPPFALYQARDARGALARAALGADGVAVVDLVLHPSEPPLPLGWMLSADARSEMNRQVDALFRMGAMQRILDWLHL